MVETNYLGAYFRQKLKGCIQCTDVYLNSIFQMYDTEHFSCTKLYCSMKLCISITNSLIGSRAWGPSPHLKHTGPWLKNKFRRPHNSLLAKGVFELTIAVDCFISFVLSLVWWFSLDSLLLMLRVRSLAFFHTPVRGVIFMWKWSNLLTLSASDSWSDSKSLQNESHSRSQLTTSYASQILSFKWRPAASIQWIILAIHDSYRN